MARVTVECESLTDRDLYDWLAALLGVVAEGGGYGCEVHRQFHGVRDSGSGQFAEKGEATSRPGETQTEGGP